MRRAMLPLGQAVGWILLVTAAAGATGTGPPSRHFDLDWTVNVEEVPDGAKEARVWIALPQELPEQEVHDLAVETDYTWKFVTDAEFGNQVVLVTVPAPPAAFAVSLRAAVDRAPVDGPRPAELTAAERSLYLRQEALVSLSPRIRAMADSIGATARSRYDYVLAAMDYDKSVPGWGRGDTERACDIGKGNCTDFHSLFMSLSRARGVPAVFEMGYPTVLEGESNKAGGYHCWAWFYDQEARAWVAVDISEADKHPEKSDYFYGHLDADRITFSRGRDVRLPEMKGKPLNYLPAGAYVEVDGRPLEEKVTRTLTYVVDQGREKG